MSNKSNGTDFEKEFAQKLSDHGFWVHRMQDNQNGEPFDVIAARDGETLGHSLRGECGLKCRKAFKPVFRS